MSEPKKKEAKKIPVLEIRCSGSGNVKLEDLKDFQKSFKELSGKNRLKLEREILTLGLCEPLTVWKRKVNADTTHFSVLNGHQRLSTIKKMVDEKRLICASLPVNLAEPKNQEDAKRIVLALTSQYGTVTKNGIREFLKGTKITDSEIQISFSFPDLDLDEFKREVADEQRKKEKAGEATKDAKSKKMFTCPKCKHTFSKDESAKS